MRLMRRHLTWSFLVGAGLAALVAGFLIPGGEEEQGLQWTHFAGFFALLGLIGCIALVYLAKWLSRFWLQRKEDYYD